MKRFLYYLNLIVYVLTLVLYLTILGGLYAQIALGAIQLLTGLIIFFFWKSYTPKIKKQLTYYWAIVAVYGSCWLVDWDDFGGDLFFIIAIILIPITIASYFMYVLNTIHKN